MSNAVATGKQLAIMYSRSIFIKYFFSIVFLYHIINWYFFNKSISLYNGLIYCNINTIIFIVFILLLSFSIAKLTSFYPVDITETSLSDFQSKRINDLQTNIDNVNKDKNVFTLKEIFQIKREHYKMVEYPLITLFIIIGGTLLLSSNDLITIFLSIELQSYGLYILSTIYRNSESSTGAGLTYFLLGGLSSCIILLALSFLYINTGTTNLDSLYLIYNIITSDNNLFSIFTLQHHQLFTSIISSVAIYTLHFYEYAIQLSLVILSVGFLFKISGAPFHSWSPGVYDAIPTVTTTFVAIIPKISILILLLGVVYSTWYTTCNFSWTSILLFSSFLSLIIGSILGLIQFRIKRLYAYSTISHIGFILLALSIHSVESIQAFYFYIIQYSLSNLNAFLILVTIGYTYIHFNKKTQHNPSMLSIHTTHEQKIHELSPIEYIDNLKGYFYLNPLLAISLSVTLYSFIGVPPLVGFFAKQMVLSSALDNGDIFICLIAILTSVISAVYYLYIVKHMFFEKSKLTLNYSLVKVINMQIQNLNVSCNDTLKTKHVISLSGWLTIIISVLSLIILLFITEYEPFYLIIYVLSILFIY